MAEVRIGVVYNNKEIDLELEEAVDAIVAQFQTAIDANERVVWLTDTYGRQVGVPTEKLAYVEVSEDGASKRVGFGVR